MNDFRANENVPVEQSVGTEAATASSALLEDAISPSLPMDKSGEKSQRDDSSSTRKYDYLSVEGMMARGVEPITDGMISAGGPVPPEQMRPWEGSVKPSEKVEPLKNSELQDMSKMLADKLVDDSSLKNDPEILKLLDRAAESNQLKVLVQLINKQLGERGSELSLTSSVKYLESQVIPFFGPAWTNYWDSHKVTLNSAGKPVDSIGFAANERGSHPDRRQSTEPIRPQPRTNQGDSSSSKSLPELRISQ